MGADTEFIDKDLEHLTGPPPHPMDPPTAAKIRVEAMDMALHRATNAPDTAEGDDQIAYYSNLVCRLADKVVDDLMDAGDGTKRVRLRVVSAYTEECPNGACEGTFDRGNLHSTGGTVPIIDCDECGVMFVMDPGDWLGSEK